MAAFADSAFSTSAFSNAAFDFGTLSLVEVPDVVGQSQASATAELEAVLFVVVVATAYSSSVAAGLVISQDPAAGIEAIEGSTVTITVSLGDAPVSNESSGGFYYEMEAHIQRRRRRKKAEEEEREAEREIQEQRDREIARLLHVQEAKDAERSELARIQAIADRYVGQGSKLGLPRNVSTSMLKAHEERSRNALEQMQREIDRMLDEEEQAVLMLLLED